MSFTFIYKTYRLMPCFKTGTLKLMSRPVLSGANFKQGRFKQTGAKFAMDLDGTTNYPDGKGIKGH